MTDFNRFFFCNSILFRSKYFANFRLNMMKRTFQIAANNFKQKQINYIWNIIIFVIVMNLNLTFTSLVGRQVSLDYEFSNYALYRWHLNSSGYRRLRIFWNICDWFELQNERTRFCRPYDVQIMNSVGSNK